MNEPTFSSLGVKPLLRWAGSKKKVVPKILSLMPGSFNRYIEPFAGSGCVFFRLLPTRSILGDFNTELISLYEIVKQHPEDLFAKLEFISNSKIDYYSVREKYWKESNKLQRAAYLLYLNRNCFNGVYRTNKNGLFNVPQGTRVGQLPDFHQISDVSRALQSTDLMASDFEDVIDCAGKGDFMYLDPPYTHPNFRDRGEYGCNAFSAIDIPRFIKSIEQAGSRGAKILVSYNSTMTKHLPNWTKKKVIVQRSVSGFSSNRQKVAEMLYLNYEE